MIKGILSSCLLILVFLFVRKVSQGHINKRIQYALWILVALKLLIFPVPWVTSPIAIFSADNMIVSNNIQLPSSMANDTNNKNIIEADKENLVDNTEEKVTFDTAEKDQFVKKENANATWHKDFLLKLGRISKPILLAIWIIGALILAVRILSQNYILKRILIENGKKYMQKDVPLDVYVVDDLATPCFYNGNIYTSEELLENPTKRKHILAHEYCHYKHGDGFWSVIRCICLVVYWWNPLVWLAVRLSKTDCELACDEAVLDLIGDEERISYGKTLISILPSKGSKFLLVASTMEGSKNNMKDRIKFIANKPKVRSSICVAVTLISIATLMCSCTVKPKNTTSLTDSDEVVQISEETTSETDNNNESKDVKEDETVSTTDTEESVASIDTEEEVQASEVASEEEVSKEKTTERDYSVCTALPAEDVENYAKDIAQIIANRKWEKLSDNIIYPITINGKKYENKEEFVAEDWNNIFSNEYIEEVKSFNVEEMWANWQGICISNGSIWLNEDSTGSLKVYAINIEKE